MIERGKSTSLQKRRLKKCDSPLCDDGNVIAAFGTFNICAQCEGAGLVDAETGEALPHLEVIGQLKGRLLEKDKEHRQLQLDYASLQRSYNREVRGK